MFTWWRWSAQLHFLSVCHLGADAVRSFINVFVVTLQNFKKCLFTIGTFLKHVLFVGTKRPSNITESAFSGWWLTVQCSISKAHKASQNGSIVTLLNLAPLTYSLKKNRGTESWTKDPDIFFSVIRLSEQNWQPVNKSSAPHAATGCGVVNHSETSKLPNIQLEFKSFSFINDLNNYSYYILFSESPSRRSFRNVSSSDFSF